MPRGRHLAYARWQEPLWPPLAPGCLLPLSPIQASHGQRSEGKEGQQLRCAVPRTQDEGVHKVGRALQVAHVGRLRRRLHLHLQFFGAFRLNWNAGTKAAARCISLLPCI